MDKRKITVGYFETTDMMRELVSGVLDSGRISYGPLCQQLEAEFARLHFSRHAVVSASGTDSLRAALHALKIRGGWYDGMEVIVPATTFVATINIITQVGLEPVFVDVDPLTYCIEPELVERAITPRTAAIIPVNLLGQPAPLRDIREIADRHALAVMEDSAEAMFVSHDLIPVGAWGDVAGFSFYMAHLITSGVGGIATTDDDQPAEIMRSLLNHGREPIYISIDDDDELEGDDLAQMVARRFNFIYSGYSSRMTELQAAIALPQLDDWLDMIARRQAVASRLTAGLSRHAMYLKMPFEREEGQHSYMMYGINMRNGINKMPLVMHLENHGIETRDLLPLVNQGIFTDWYSGMDIQKDYPVSCDLIDTGFYIGSHQGMSDADADYVCEVVDDFFGD